MKKQLQSMGLPLDWAREVARCDPAYYKHQQKMFLGFLKPGLVALEYRNANWDPVDQAVLANADGSSALTLKDGVIGRQSCG